MTRAGAVLVTGASRGIGRAVAEKLAARGDVVIAVARSADALAELATAHLGKVVPLALDLVESPDAVRVALDGGHVVDRLVHAAGESSTVALDALDADALVDQYRLHTVPAVLMTRSLAAAEPHGAAVFVSSTLTQRPAPNRTAYAAAKGALEAAARSMASEVAPRGFRINVVSPGLVDTDMARGLDVELDALAALHPLGRIGSPDEVADTILHALDSAWMTGSVLTIDGGLSGL